MDDLTKPIADALVASWSVSDDFTSQATARKAAERDAATVMTVVGPKVIELHDGVVLREAQIQNAGSQIAKLMREAHEAGQREQQAEADVERWKARTRTAEGRLDGHAWDDLTAERDALIDEVKSLQGDLEELGEAQKTWVQFRRERDALKAAHKLVERAFLLRMASPEWSPPWTTWDRDAEAFLRADETPKETPGKCRARVMYRSGLYVCRREPHADGDHAVCGDPEHRHNGGCDQYGYLLTPTIPAPPKGDTDGG